MIKTNFIIAVDFSQQAKRFKCTEIKSKRIYLFSPVAEVEIVED